VRQSTFRNGKDIPFSALSTADLIIDAVYEGCTKGNTADDVLGKLIPGAGNQGGFRQVGSWDAPRLAVLYSSMDDSDWPDSLMYTRVCSRILAITRNPASRCTRLPVAIAGSCNRASPTFTVNHRRVLRSCLFSFSQKARKGATWCFEGWPFQASKGMSPMIWSRYGAARAGSGSRIIAPFSRF
jgi:hypothetical protein